MASVSAVVLAAIVGLGLAVVGTADERPEVVVMPLVNGTVSGWLVDYATERNYMVNTYLAQLDALDGDPRYAVSVVEVPNMIALKELAPERYDDLRRHVASGRAELGSALFLNPTVSLTGGEALMRLGIEGIRWQEAEFQRRSRVAWLVDTEGLHRQMPQISRALGLDVMLYTRNNPAGQMTHRWRSPDGSTVLAVGTGRYNGIQNLFGQTRPLLEPEYRGIVDEIRQQRTLDAPNVPTLILAGPGDYGMPPKFATQTSQFVEKWNSEFPNEELVFAGSSTYGAALEDAASGATFVDIDTDAPLSRRAFWVNMPRVKQAIRRAEHDLAAAEALATVASLSANTSYPSQDLSDAWINLLMNMDRNIIWGAGAGAPFESATSWDARDRFDAITSITARVAGQALAAISGPIDGPAGGQEIAAGEVQALTLFNPLAWDRREPVTIEGTGGRGVEGEPCERILSTDAVVCMLSMPAFGIRTVRLGDIVEPPAPIELNEPVMTASASVVIDPRTGDLTSVRARASGTELLGGSANTLVLEQHRDGTETQDDLHSRADRRILGSTGESDATVSAWRGAVATTVDIRQVLPEGVTVRRMVRLYPDHPRIDLEATVAEVPTGRIVSADFRMSQPIVSEERGIPFGSSSPVSGPGVHPAIRWSALNLGSGRGLAVIDRGIPGRELAGDTLVVTLVNAHDAYRGIPNPWLSGRGEQRFSYSLVPLEAGWQAAGIPRQAWERNAPPLIRFHQTAPAAAQTRSWLRTSPNVIVEAVRRVGPEIEIRLVEWSGTAGPAEVTVNLPYQEAFITDALGERRERTSAAGPIRLNLRPQQIVTLRLATATAVPDVPPIQSFASLVPPAKLPSMSFRHNLSGHPPER